MASRDADPSIARDPSRCVVCGEPNDCALAREGADPSTPCWCVSEIFPKPLVAWLAEEKRQERCLCRRCLMRHRAGDPAASGEAP